MILTNSLKFLSCVLIVCLCALILRSYFFVEHLDVRTSAFLNEGQTTFVTGNKSLTSLGNFADFQIEQLQSPRAQKSLQASLETLAVFNATGRLLNKQILPRAMRGLDASDSAIRNLGLLVANTDKSLNGEGGLISSTTQFVQALTSTANRFQVTVETFTAMLQAISEKTGLSLDAIYALVNSPEWMQALQNVAVISSNVAATTQKADATIEQIRLAMLKAPSIALSLEKIAKDGSKFSKITLLVNILSTIAKTFLF
jgi:hypothetical protein